MKPVALSLAVPALRPSVPAPSERVPVYCRAAFARALEENAPLNAPSADGAEGIRLRVFLGKHDGRVAILPAE